MEENKAQKMEKVINMICEKRNCKVYKKMKGSTSDGCIYTIEDKKTGRLFEANISIKKMQCGLRFVMSSGIHIADRAFVPALSRYIQSSVSTRFGNLNTGCKYEEVVYVAETSYLDNITTEETLDLYEEEAMRVLSIHYENLNKLSHGQYDISPIEVKPLGKRRAKFNKKGNYEVIERYLMNKSNYNSVCKSINEEGAFTFYSQVITHNATYRIKHIIDESCGILTVLGTVGGAPRIIPDAYLYAVSEYINSFNSQHIFGSLWVGNEKDGYYCKFSTSLLDGGTIGVETLDFMQRMVLQVLDEVKDSIEALALGMLIKKEEDKEKEEFDRWSKMIDDVEKRRKELDSVPVPRYLQEALELPDIDDKALPSDDIEISEDDVLMDEFLESIFGMIDDDKNGGV